jgi:hypothetical protein
MELFYDDWLSIITRITQKKRDKGFLNRELDLKMKQIEFRIDLIKKAARAGKQIQHLDTQNAID